MGRKDCTGVRHLYFGNYIGVPIFRETTLKESTRAVMGR